MRGVQQNMTRQVRQSEGISMLESDMFEMGQKIEQFRPLICREATL